MSPAPRRILAATGNSDKLREIRNILDGSGWDLLGLDEIPPYPEPEETGVTLKENALIKAREGFLRSGMLTLADDSGLEVDALNGEPGIYSSRYAGPGATYQDNTAKLLSELKGIPESRRTARFRCVMALVGEGVESTWEGVAEGSITLEPHGFNGFGYDPVFRSPELGMTFAEAPAAEKDRVSHRGRALTQLRYELDRLSPTPEQ